MRRLYIIMDVFSDGVITFLNGIYTVVSTLISPVALFLVLSAGSLMWLARVEVADLDRRAAKPEVGRH